MQPRIGVCEYAGARTVVTVRVPPGLDGAELGDAEPLSATLRLIDDQGSVIFHVSDAIVGAPIAYNNAAVNEIKIAFGSTPGLSALLANASVIGTRIELATPTGTGLRAVFSSVESVDEVALKVIPPIAMDAAYIVDGMLCVRFPRPMNVGDAANDDNQTILSMISADDLQVRGDAAFTGDEPSPSNLGEAFWKDETFRTICFPIVRGAGVAPGLFIRARYDGKAAAQHDFRDLVGNIATDVAVVIDDEEPAAPPPPPMIPPCGSDMNGDGQTNSSDLGTLLALWGTDDDGADLNNNGVVNSSDLAILLAAWGPCPDTACGF